ncbi:MAG TPA: YciI family protein [Chitinophagaceae bacterium]|nr:YciI family protein [Chitinophagaceae bacterium]
MEKKYFALTLLPGRPDFAQTMTPEERAAMLAHIDYWKSIMAQGKVLVFGPVLDPASVYGLGIVVVDDEKEVAEFIANDPASSINRYVYHPMRAVVPEK